MRHKLLTLLKPQVRQAIMKGAGQSKVGVFGNDEVVFKKTVQSRKKGGSNVILTLAASKSKSKSRKKSKAKTGMKGASPKKDGEAGKAGEAKRTKMSKAAKVKAKKAKANSAAKTDRAGTAPQQGSGESSTTAALGSLHSVSLRDYDSEIRCELFWQSNFFITVCSRGSH